MKKVLFLGTSIALALTISGRVFALSGTWTNATSNGNWSTAANWKDGIQANGADYTADFSTLNITGDRTVNLDIIGGRTIGHLVFGDTTPSHNWILSSTSSYILTLDVTSDSPTITVNNQTATISLVLAGNDGMNKLGAGTLILSGANTYTGTTTIRAGTLRYGAAGAIHNDSDVVVDGGTFDVVSHNDSVGVVTLVSGSIIGTSGVLTGKSYSVQSGTISAILGGSNITLTKTTEGTVTLSGTNTYTGLTSVLAGTLAYGASSVISSGPVTVNGATAILNMGSYVDTVATVTVDGGGQITGTGTLTVNSGSGSFEMKSGTVSVNLAGSAALNKTTSGTVTLRGANSYSGITTLSAGVLRATTNAAALGGGTLTLAGGELQLANDTGLNFGRNTAVTANVQITSDRLTSGVGVTHTLGTLSIGAQTLTIARGDNVASGRAGISFSGTVTVSANAIINTEAGAATTLASFSGTSSSKVLTLGGAGNFTVTGAPVNTYLNVSGSGTVTFSGGFSSGNTLSISGSGTVNTGSFTSGNTVNISGTGQVSVGNFTGTNTLNVSGDATVTIGGCSENANNTITISSNGTTTITGNFGASGNDFIFSGGSGNTFISGNYTSTSGADLTLQSGFTGTVTLSGNNTYGSSGSSTTTVSGGILIAANANALGTPTPTVNSGGTLAVASGITLTKVATWNSGSTLAGLGTYRPGTTTAADTSPRA